jgi:subtilisin family serine protease
MSMGGLPSRSWAKAINKAYEAGITIVTAAGNSWVKGFAKIAPKKVLYPARFDRVITASGVCYNQYPYVAAANPDFGRSKAAGGEYMQGNYLPKSAMKTAIAAYTPNIPWAIFSDRDKTNPIILKTGGGTSSATPQIAAAAALWIVKNKQELIERGYYGTWKQVEAVRYALFNSAEKQNIVGWKKYYGNGILKASAALKIDVPNDNELKKSDEARVTLGIFNYINLIIFRKSDDSNNQKIDKERAEMIFQEIIQVMEQDPKLIELYRDVDLVEIEQQPDGINEKQFLEICNQVALSPYSSEYLKSILF